MNVLNLMGCIPSQKSKPNILFSVDFPIEIKSYFVKYFVIIMIERETCLVLILYWPILQRY